MFYGLRPRVRLPPDLYVVALKATGRPQPRKLITGSDELGGISPLDWSPDGKSIAVILGRKDRTTQIALVAAVDGSVRVVKSMDWRGPSRIFISPDGKHVAYDRPVSDTGEQYDVQMAGSWPTGRATRHRSRSWWCQSKAVPRERS